MPEKSAPTTDQLRRDIDTGRTGDKTDNIDPAAAPLGTDDEAAGTGPRPADVAAARAQQSSNVSPELGRSTNSRGSAVWVLLIIAAAIVLLVGALGLSRR